MLSDITLFTCNFNNNLMTKCMIMSFFKQYGEVPVVIMDNSTIEYCSDNIKSMFTVIDNTNFKIIKNYNQISRNHCASIDYVLKNCIKTKYVILCDNDVLFKPEIKTLLNELDNIDAVGEIDYHKKLHKDWRLLPFFCIINVEKMKKENINYFDQNRCMNQYDTCFDDNGNWKNNIIKDNLEYGDTGSSFLWDIQKANWNIKKIDLHKYINHYAMASWNPEVKYNIVNWLDINSNLWKN